MIFCAEKSALKELKIRKRRVKGNLRMTIRGNSSCFKDVLTIVALPLR